MKKVFYQIVSCVLALCMCLFSGVAAFASEKEYDGKTVILHTNDAHGAIEKYTYIAGLKKDFEEKGAEVILCDAGDFSQGSTGVSADKGAFAVALMNAAGYDIAVPGNHEFDYGILQLEKNLAAADFSVLCANVLRGEKALFDENLIYETNSGLKIGFFGLDTPETRTKANPSLIRGLSFLDGEKLYSAAEKQVKALCGADIVICISHLGTDKSSSPNRSYDLYKNVEGIDFIIDGHSHTEMTGGENGEPVQSAGEKLSNAGVIVINSSTKRIEENYLIGVDDTVPADESVRSLAEARLKKIDEEYGTVFAKSLVKLNGEKAPGNRTKETNLGDLITDAMLWAVKREEGSLEVPEENVLAVTNGGGIRDSVSKGDVTKNDVNTVLPFGNTLTVVYVTGGQLLEALEASTCCTPEPLGGFPQTSGMTFTLDTTKKYNAQKNTYPDSTYYGPETVNRVFINDINGRPFDEDAVYAVVTNDFCASGGDTYYAFTGASGLYDTGIPLDEVLMEYISSELGGEIGGAYAAPQGRISVKMSLGSRIKTVFLNIGTAIKNFFSWLAEKAKGLFKK